MAAHTPQITLKEARTLLGVEPTATAGDLRRAFREAAKQAHPDRPGGDEARFRQVVDAYNRLRQIKPDAAWFMQPPAPCAPAPEHLSIPPQVAFGGGSVEHALPDGRRIRLRLPAGLRTGDRVRAGQAELSVVVRGSEGTVVRGDDLWVTATVDPRTLAEGGRISLETPLGRRIVWVTRKAGEKGLVRLAGAGLPARGRHPQGHLFIRLASRTSARDTAARALLRRFAAAWAA